MQKIESAADGARGELPEEPPSASAECLSQRERRRRETWASIHAAAYGLVGELGLDGATVDLIAERAGVSRRTFFNYFATKEDAVLGLVPAHCPDHVLDAFRGRRDDPFRSTIRLLVGILRASFPSALPMPERRRLARQSPVLGERLEAQLLAAETLAGDILAEQLEDIESRAVLPEGIHREDAARALIIFAGGVMKYVARTDPDALFDDTEGGGIDRAIDVFRFILKETL